MCMVERFDHWKREPPVGAECGGCSARPARASGMAVSCSQVSTRLLISPGQIFGGLMNGDEAGG